MNLHSRLGELFGLCLGRRMLVGWATERNWGVGIGDTLGGHYYSLLPPQRVSWASNAFQAWMHYPVFTRASRESLCFYKFICSYCPFSDETWTCSLDPWRDLTVLQVCVLDRLYLLRNTAAGQILDKAEIHTCLLKANWPFLGW